MTDETKEEGSAPSQEVISRAKEMGWSPKEEWRGNPDQWIDADAFVERGETLMPILKANNRKLTSELHSTRAQLSEAQRIIQANTEAIEELKKFNTTSLRQQATAQKKELAKAIAEARREGNFEEELDLTERLNETTRVLKETEEQPRGTKPKPNGQAPSGSGEPNPAEHPEFKAFVEENPWFNKDRRKTSLALAIAEELRSDPEWKSVVGKPFFDKVVKEVNETLGGEPKPQSSKVEGGVGNGTSSNGNGSSRGKGYSSLPSDAKAACDKQAARLVGEGRAYKTIDDWRKAYAQKYFEE